MSKILLVDDSSLMRHILKNILTKNGHQIIGEAHDGIEAYDKYKELQPDLVTMDIVMPYCDGITATKNIIHDFPDAKIVMCSSMGHISMIADSISAGAKEFIIKPFSASSLMNTVNKLVC